MHVWQCLAEWTLSADDVLFHSMYQTHARRTASGTSLSREQVRVTHGCCVMRVQPQHPLEVRARGFEFLGCGVSWHDVKSRGLVHRLGCSPRAKQPNSLDGTYLQLHMRQRTVHEHVRHGVVEPNGVRELLHSIRVTLCAHHKKQRRFAGGGWWWWWPHFRVAGVTVVAAGDWQLRCPYRH